MLPLPEPGTVRLTARPEARLRPRLGKGQTARAPRSTAASVGLIVDTRGRRPFALPARSAARIARLQAWNTALGVYPQED